MNIPDSLTKSWAIAQKANPSMIESLVEKHRDLWFCKIVGSFCIAAALMLLALNIFSTELSLSDKHTAWYVIAGVAVVAILFLVFRPRLTKDEVTILNSLRADFKALSKILKTYKISHSRLVKCADDQGYSLEKEFSSHVDPAHTGQSELVLKSLRSLPARWCWLALKDLALKVQEIDNVAAVVKTCKRSVDEKSVFKKMALKSSIEDGITTGQKFLLFSKFVTLGSFFEIKGPGGVW